MSIAVLRDIMATAMDIKNTLAGLGVDLAPATQSTIPSTPEFTIPSAEPLRAHLMKIGLCAATATTLNRIYIDHANKYRSETAQELRALWQRLHEEHGYNPVGSWQSTLFIVQKQARQALDNLFTVVVNLVTRHLKDLCVNKRKSQTVFDQRVVEFLLWVFTLVPDQKPTREDKHMLSKRTGLTYKQIDIWFQNRRARTKKSMVKSGQNLKEVLGNPKRPTFGTLPEPMIKLAQAKKIKEKEKRREQKRQDKREQMERERASRPRRAKVELTRSLIREENDPPLDWLCPCAQNEKATRDKLKSGELKGIDSWSAPAYAYPMEWSEKTRDAWWQVDIPCVSEFEHKSTPHPNEPKDVSVADEEIDALEKQFAGLKIEVVKKIYWHQYPDGRLEAIHPKLVRVRKNGTFFMYDDDEFQGNPKPTPAPFPVRPTRPRRGESASRPIIIDQLGSASDPIILNDPGSSAQEPIVLDIPGASAAEPILVGFPGTSAGDAISVDVPGASAADPIVVHYPGISIGDPIIVDVSGISANDPIVVDTTEAPLASSALPRVTNPIVIVSIPEATEATEEEEDMEPASQVGVKETNAGEGEGRMPSPESAVESDSGSSRASSSPGTGFSPSNASFSIPSPSFSFVGDGTFANGIEMFVTQHSLPPASYPYPYEDVQVSLPPGIFDVPGPGTLPVDLSMLNPFVTPATTILSAERFLVESMPPEVPIIDPVQTHQPRTLEEELAEIFKNIDTNNPQAQILPQGDINWDALLAPPTVATVYQSIPEVPGSASSLPSPEPQAQIVVEPQPDLFMQMQTGQFDTWAALYGDTYLELPRMEDIPPPSAWEGAFDPTVQAFLDQLWASDAAADAAAASIEDSTTSAALLSQGFDTFNLEFGSITG